MRHVNSPSEPKTASKATRLFFEVLDSSGVPRPIVAEKAGIHVNNFYGWKSGRISATIVNMEAALAVLGMEFCIRPIQQRQECRKSLSPDKASQDESLLYAPFAHLDF